MEIKINPKIDFKNEPEMGHMGMMVGSYGYDGWIIGV